MNRRHFLVAGAALLGAPACAQPVVTREAFDSWVAAAEASATLNGVSEASIKAARVGLAMNPGLIRPAGAQPESKRVGIYVKSLIGGDGPIALKKLAQFPRIRDIQTQLGVPASVLVAFWGRESGYGRDFGSLDVFSTLASLGAAQRGATDWTAEYVAALTILDRRVRPRAQLTGSAAGALGHTQLMPSSYLTYGMDFDGDGRADIWSPSPLDALASAARHIQDVPAADGPVPPVGKAWKRGQGWIEPARLPLGFDLTKVEVEETKLTLGEWAALGLRPTGGLAASDLGLSASLALPAGVNGPALLLLPNYDVFERYNPSRTYALGVGLLARHIEGRAPVAWPDETPLTLDDRQAAQRGLTALGFYSGPIDGDLGRGSRKAVRAWQKSVGRPADGYLTSDAVTLLRR